MKDGLCRSRNTKQWIDVGGGEHPNWYASVFLFLTPQKPCDKSIKHQHIVLARMPHQK